MMNTLRHIAVQWLIFLILRVVPKDDCGMDLVASLGQWSARSLERAPQHFRDRLYEADKRVAIWMSTDGENYTLISRTAGDPTVSEIRRQVRPFMPKAMPKAHIKLCRLDQRLSELRALMIYTGDYDETSERCRPRFANTEPFNGFPSDLLPEMDV